MSESERLRHAFASDEIVEEPDTLVDSMRHDAIMRAGQQPVIDLGPHGRCSLHKKLVIGIERPLLRAAKQQRRAFEAVTEADRGAHNELLLIALIETQLIRVAIEVAPGIDTSRDRYGCAKLPRHRREQGKRAAIGVTGQEEAILVDSRQVF